MNRPEHATEVVLATALQHAVAMGNEIIRLREALERAEYDFKNFHRLLCERVGYHHDPIDWRRDQLSLIEQVALVTVLKQFYAHVS